MLLARSNSYFRQQGAHFNGQSIPFGCRVFFKPSPISKHQTGKFESNCVPGIMLGYVLDPGGKWSGEFLVVELAAMAGKPMHRNTPAGQLRVHVQRVRELLPVKKADVFYPLRETYMRANYTLEGIEAHKGIERGTTEYDLPPDPPSDGVQGAQRDVEGVTDDNVEAVQTIPNDDDDATTPTTKRTGDAPKRRKNTTTTDDYDAGGANGSTRSAAYPRA